MSELAPISVAEAEADTRFAPLFNLILLDDDDHSYEYVIFMLMKLFGFQARKALQCAIEVDTSGRVIVMTNSFERVEFKQSQIHGYGGDPTIRNSAGAMSAIIEAVP